MKGKAKNNMHRHMKDMYEDDDLTGYKTYPPNEDIVPGSELDDDMEISGEEDEENNHYSLGGDNHNDLEEDYN